VGGDQASPTSCWAVSPSTHQLPAGNPAASAAALCRLPTCASLCPHAWACACTPAILAFLCSTHPSGCGSWSVCQHAGCCWAAPARAKPALRRTASHLPHAAPMRLTAAGVSCTAAKRCAGGCVEVLWLAVPLPELCLFSCPSSASGGSCTWRLPCKHNLHCHAL